MSRRRAALSATALAVGALLASGPAASAAHIEVADGTLVFTAEVGERNDVQAGARNLPTFTINDDGAPLTAGAGCVQVSPSSATCDEDPLNPLPLSIATRDGDDRVLVDDDFARVV